MIKIKEQKDKYIPLTKEQFVKAINDLEDCQRRINNIQTVLEENCWDAIYCPPTVEETLIDVLSEAFNDKDEDISYFIYELDFGKDWKPGTITTDNGEDIKMQTAEDLYDYLVSNLD